MNAVRPTALALLLAVAVAGCRPADPLDWTVSARTPAALTSWRARIESDANVETRRHVETAMQEIRMKITGDRDSKRRKGEVVDTSTASVNEALCEQVNGKPLREVLQLGYELRVARLITELAGLEDAMNKNAQLLTRPGDLESRHHLDGLRERQMVRVEKYRADLAAAERELAPFLKTNRRLSPELQLPTDSPDDMPTRVKAEPKKI